MGNVNETDNLKRCTTIHDDDIDSTQRHERCEHKSTHYTRIITCHLCYN